MSTVMHHEQAAASQSVGRTIGSAEQFLSKNKIPLIVALVAVVVIAGGFFGYRELVQKPRHTEAMSQLFVAEQYFVRDSFNLALNGDGNTFGFLQIEAEYGSAAGVSLPYYIGACQLQLGNFNEAIAAFKRYRGTDDVLPARALCCIGDAYCELDDLKAAYNYYMQAANYRSNDYTAQYLMKAAGVSEAEGNTEAALQLYRRIKDEHPQTTEGSDIDRYIARLNPAI